MSDNPAREPLTDAEIDSLTECECGHWANEHSVDGCLATDYDGDGMATDDDVCACFNTPVALNIAAIEAILAARLAARDAEWRAKVETLAARRDDMARAWGGDSGWMTTGRRVADVIHDWDREWIADLLAEMGTAGEETP